MIRLADTIGDDGVVAAATKAPYDMIVKDGKYAIVNNFTGVIEYEGNNYFVEVIALLEAFESTYNDYTQAGSVTAMRLGAEAKQTKTLAEALRDVSKPH